MSPPVLSVNTVVSEQTEKERKAQKTAEVCGDKLEKCTFSEGYITQSVYVCLTCSREGKPLAGMCLGCSMNCHLNHEILELWTKRDFRCDCGTSRLPSPCCLQPKSNKVTNEKNKYTDNFRGLYCYCKQPESEDSGDMFMCSRCEDWFHWKCLDKTGEAPEAENFLCNPCAQKVDHLLPYSIEAQKEEGTIEAMDSRALNKKRKASTEDVMHQKKRRVRGEACTRNVISTTKSNKLLEQKGFFFAPGWTETLCRCAACDQLLRDADMYHIFEENSEANFFDEINVTEPDRAAPVNPAFSMNSMASAAISQFPTTRVLDVIAEQNRFHNAIKSELLNVRGVITEIQMRDIIARVKNQLRAESFNANLAF